MDLSRSDKDSKAEYKDQKMYESMPPATGTSESTSGNGIEEGEKEMIESMEIMNETMRLLGPDENTGTTRAKVYWDNIFSYFKAKVVELDKNIEERKDTEENVIALFKGIVKSMTNIPYKTERMKELVQQAEKIKEQMEALREQMEAPREQMEAPRSPAALTEDVILEGLTKKELVMYNALKTSNLHQDFLKGKLKDRLEVRARDAALRARDAALRARDAALRARDARLWARDAALYLFETSKAMTRCDTTITALSGLSQAEGTNIGLSIGTATKEAVEREIDEEKVRKRARKDPPMPAAANSNDAFREVLDKCVENDSFLELGEQQDLDLHKRLLFVYQSIEAYLKNAVFLDASTTDYKQRVKRDMDNLHKTVSACLRKGTIDAPPTWSGDKERVAPGPDTHEVDGSEVFLLVLFRLIGECLHPPYIKVTTSNCLAAASPLKKETKNQNIMRNPIDKQPKRVERRCDVVLSKEGRHAFVIWDDAMQLGGEVKPGTRKNMTILDLLGEARDQALSHSAKYVAVSGLNFAQAGVPSHAFMFVVNMGCIQVYKLTLEDVGTPNAKVVLYKSGLHPLLSKEATERWTNSSSQKSPGHEKDFNEFLNTLFPSNDSGQMSEDFLPSGIRVICALMQKRRNFLFGPTVEVKSKNEAESLGDLLGSGTFSTVFRSTNDPNECIKMSRYGRIIGLKNEAKILGMLGEHDCENVSKLAMGVDQDLPTMDVLFGGLEWRLPYIRTTPVGVPSYLSFVSYDKKSEWIGNVLSGLDSGIGFLKNHGIVHRDLNPSNIVIVPVGIRPIIIDFSISTKTSEAVVGFRGTVQYAHWKSFTFYPNTTESWKKKTWDS